MKTTSIHFVVTFLSFLVRNSLTFVPLPLHNSQLFQSKLQMCICIDCARVTSCDAYHFVETKHEQPHISHDPTFTPQNGSPTIHVTIRSTQNSTEESRLLSEHAQETADAAAEANSNENLHGKTVYNLSPATTVEYDVVACQDFLEDKGCWVRNMPEEIRLANPDFVPS